MANKPLKTIKFPGLPDIYTIPEVDASLATTGKAADAKAVGDAVNDLQNAIDEIEPGLSDEAKTALLACFQHVAWVDEHGQSYYNALESALYEDVPAALRSIAATFNQGSAIIYTDTALDDLKQYLTVTARYSDGTSHAVTGYILSGTLREGTSAVTVTYGGKSTSFTIQNVIDFYNIWEWDSQNTNHSKLTRTPTAAFEKTIDSQKLGIQYSASMISENRLRGFAVTRGKWKMRNGNDGSEVDFYPIPIPATATKLTATITPATQKLAVYVFKYTGNSREDGYNYELVAPDQIGYVTGQYVLNFTSDSDLFLTFNCKPANGNYSANPEPEMHILFE